MYRASCLFAHSPRQPAESGSLTLRSINLLSLPSDLTVGQRRPCESDSLPHEQGEAAASQRQGLPASLGKQKADHLAGWSAGRLAHRAYLRRLALSADRFGGLSKNSKKTTSLPGTLREGTSQGAREVPLYNRRSRIRTGLTHGGAKTDRNKVLMDQPNPPRSTEKKKTDQKSVRWSADVRLAWKRLQPQRQSAIVCTSLQKPHAHHDARGAL